MEIFQVSRTGHYPTILIYADNDYDAIDQWWMIAIFLLVNKREFIWLWEGSAVAVTGCEKTLKSQNLGATKQKKEKIYLWKENLLTMMMMMMMMMMMTEIFICESELKVGMWAAQKKSDVEGISEEVQNTKLQSNQQKINYL